MDRILKWINTREPPTSINWIEVQTHDHVKLNEKLIGCDFKIEHNNDRSVASLKSYLNTLDVNKYFNDLVSCDSRVQCLLLL